MFSIGSVKTSINIPWIVLQRRFFFPQASKLFSPERALQRFTKLLGLLLPHIMSEKLHILADSRRNVFDLRMSLLLLVFFLLPHFACMVTGETSIMQESSWFKYESHSPGDYIIGGIISHVLRGFARLPFDQSPQPDYVTYIK